MSDRYYVINYCLFGRHCWELFPVG